MCFKIIPSYLGHNMSEGDGSTDGDSINGRNPSSTGMGCFKNFEHAHRNRVYSSQVLVQLIEMLPSIEYWIAVRFHKLHIYFELIISYHVAIDIGSRWNESGQSETTPTRISSDESAFAHRRRWVWKCRRESIVNVWFAAGHANAYDQSNDGNASCKWFHLIYIHSHTN